MCRQCTPNNDGDDCRALDRAVEASARDLLQRNPMSRRRILQAGLGLLALPVAQMLQACATVPITDYDPRESILLWQRMNQSGSGRPPEFLSTHPNPDTRITQLNNWMPQAWRYYENPNLALPNMR